MRRKVMDELIRWKESGERICPIIRGARHVGKTYIVTEFGRTNYRSFIRFDLSTDSLARAAFDGDLTVDSIVMKLSGIGRSNRFIPRETLIFLDEIQECPNARTALKSFAEDGRYDVIASGSLLGMRKYDVPSYPVGYEEIIEMHPMDFEEFVWALGMGEQALEHVKRCIRERRAIGDGILRIMNEYARWYTVVGGMPAAVGKFAGEHKLDGVLRVHNRIFSAYLDDVTKHAEAAQRTNVEGCFRSISMQLAKENKRFMYSDATRTVDGISRRKGDRTSGGSNRGLEDYAYALNWLQDAGISVPCFNVSQPVPPLWEYRKGGMFKLYMVDTGLLLSRYDSSVRAEILMDRPDVNRSAVTENLVAQMLSSQGYGLFYFHREYDSNGSRDRLEVDFLIQTPAGTTAVEVKSGRNRSCRSLNKIMSEYGTGGVMFETRDVFVDDKGVEHFPLFAAAFMDCVFPKEDYGFDFGLTDRLNSMFDKDSGGT